MVPRKSVTLILVALAYVCGAQESPLYPKGRCVSDYVLELDDCKNENMADSIFVFDDVSMARGEEKIAASVAATGLGTAKCKAMLTTLLCQQCVFLPSTIMPAPPPAGCQHSPLIDSVD